MTIYNKAVHSKVKTCAAVAFATCNINKYRRAFGNIDIKSVSAVTRHRIPCIHIDGENIHAFIIGEHGDSELAVWSGANVSGIDLDQFCQLRGGVDNCHLDQLYRQVRDSAYEIIRRKGATYYGIAMAVGRIAQCLVRDEHSVLPVSVVLEGQYGLEGLALSIPSVVGRNGLEEVLEIPLNGEERQALEDSARQMKEAIESLDL